MDKIDEVLSRGVEKIYPSKSALEKILRSGVKIRLYQGFDPSAPSLHLGNTVGLLKLKQFQDLGHKVIFLIGDFTGMIGDPTGKLSARPQLTKEQTLKNAKNWRKQVGRILDFKGKNPAKILYNSRWLSKLTLADLLGLSRLLTYQQIVKRKLFKERLKKGKDIFLHEFLYPMMQAYDSVAMDVDLEIGGKDQMFNMLVGRDLMHKIKHKEKFVMTTRLIVGPQGEKIGKTTGHALFLNASASNLYGGVMSFPDEAIIAGFELLTMVPLQLIEEYKKAFSASSRQAKKLNPMALKKQLAFEIVKIYHGEKKAEEAAAEFERVFQKKNPPVKIPVFSVKKSRWLLADLLVQTKLLNSKSEAKRIIKQRAVKVDRKVVSDPHQTLTIKDETIIRCGRKKFIKIKP